MHYQDLSGTYCVLMVDPVVLSSIVRMVHFQAEANFRKYHHLNTAVPLHMKCTGVVRRVSKDVIVLDPGG